MEFRRYVQKFTAMEALDQIFADEDTTPTSVDVVILPPDNVDELTDQEDLCDEIIGRTNNPLDVCGSVEVQLDTDGCGESRLLDDSYENSEAPQGSSGVVNQQLTTHGPIVVMEEAVPPQTDTKEDKVKAFMCEADKVGKGIWKENIADTKIPFNAKEKSPIVMEKEMRIIEECGGKSPHEVFEMFCDRELRDMIVENTNLYAGQKNDLNFNLDDEKLTIFIAILMFTGYHTLPRQRMYWEKEPDAGTELVYNAMSRKDFEDIKKYPFL